MTGLNFCRSVIGSDLRWTSMRKFFGTSLITKVPTRNNESKGRTRRTSGHSTALLDEPANLPAGRVKERPAVTQQRLQRLATRRPDQLVVVGIGDIVAAPRIDDIARADFQQLARH